MCVLCLRMCLLDRSCMVPQPVSDVHPVSRFANAVSSRGSNRIRPGYPVWMGEPGLRVRHWYRSNWSGSSGPPFRPQKFETYQTGEPILFSQKVQSPVVDANASVASIPSSRTIPNKAKYFRTTHSSRRAAERRWDRPGESIFSPSHPSSPSRRRVPERG